MSEVIDPAGMLTRSELARLARPVAAEPREPAQWVGSATGEVQHWRVRALSAEAELRACRAALRLWTVST